MPLNRCLLLLSVAIFAAAPLPSQTLTPGPEILVATTSYRQIREAAPAIALRTDGGFVSAWRDGPAINTRAFSATGEPVSTVHKISANEEDSPRLAALASGGFVAVWTHFTHQPPFENIILVQRLDSLGNRLGVPLEVDRGLGAAGFAGYPAVAAEPGGGFLVAWWSSLGVRVQRFDPLGATVGETITAGPQGSFPAVTTLPGGFAVAWSGSAQAGVQAFATDGTPSGPPTTWLSTAEGPIGWEISMSADAAGRFVVGWTEEGRNLTPYRVFARRFSPTGQPLGDPVLVASTANSVAGAFLTSVAARPDGSFLAVWEEHVTVSGGPQNEPGNTVPVGGNVWARAYDAAGEPLGPAFLVHDGEAGEQHDGQAVADAGGWLVTWMQRLEGSRVAARRLTLSCGTAVGLCLNGNRFRAEVAWKVPATGQQGAGTPLPLSEDTGAFWFFNAANVELFVKVLDGRALNGHYWVFYGSLTDVEFDLTVTDTVSGQVRTYHNPAGTMASRADTMAF